MGRTPIGPGKGGNILMRGKARKAAESRGKAGVSEELCWVDGSSEVKGVLGPLDGFIGKGTAIWVLLALFEIGFALELSNPVVLARDRTVSEPRKGIEEPHIIFRLLLQSGLQDGGAYCSEGL